MTITKVEITRALRDLSQRLGALKMVKTMFSAWTPYNWREFFQVEKAARELVEEIDGPKERTHDVKRKKLGLFGRGRDSQQKRGAE